MRTNFPKADIVSVLVKMKVTFTTINGALKQTPSD